MAKAKIHSHATRWQCTHCGYIFTPVPIKRAGEADVRPETCPECGSPAIAALEEGRT